VQELDLTIVLLNYNQSRFFDDAWKSVKNQTIVPKHIFVVDDGSRVADSQAVVQIIQEDLYREVRQFIDKDNLGISKRLNTVLPEIDTTWFTVLAADDLLTTDALLHFSQNLSEEVDVVWGNLELMDEQGRELNYARPRDTWQGPVAHSYLEPGFPFNDLLRYNNFIPGGMTLIRTSAVRQAGGWDEDITTEDFDLWLRIGRSSRFKYIDKSVGRYRVVSGSKSRMDSHKILDHARLLGKQTGVSAEVDKRLAYLAAMRWAFTVFRTRNFPTVSLPEMAEIMNLSAWTLRSQLPKAIVFPILGSLFARIRNHSH
jgi:GT2 family glycosyltransferase